MDKIDKSDKNQITELSERLRLMLDATPLACRLMKRVGERNFELLECNEESVKLFKFKNKQEFIERYFETYPEFQPDGRNSVEEGHYLFEKAYINGRCSANFYFQATDGEVIPSEVTLVRVKYGDDYVIAGYTRDLREQRKMETALQKRDKLLNVINLVAGILLSAANEENFEKSLIKAMRFIGECVDADCVQIWPNEMRGGVLCFALKYTWRSETGLRDINVVPGTAVPYSQRWSELFSRGECVNGPITELPQEDQDLLLPIGLTSTVTIPLYYQEKFWGILCVDDCTKCRYFSDEEIGILRSAALMLVNAIRRNAQAVEIREAQKHTKILLDSSPLAAHLWDKDGRIFACNEESVRLFKIKDKQDYLNKFWEFSPEYQPDGSKSDEAGQFYLKKAFAEGKCVFEWMHRTSDGESLPTEITLVRVAYGDSYAIAGYCRDLREHNRMMEIIGFQLAKLNLAVKATKIALWEMDINKDDPVNPGNYIIWSDEVRYMLGYTDKNDFPDVIDSFSNCLHPDDKERVPEALANHLFDKTGKTPYDLEYRLQKKNGEYAYFRASGETIRDSDGNPVRVVGTLMDITETKNILLDTEKMRIEAEAANKAKSVFLSTMSHEIRTPMNAILGITEIQLQNDNLDFSVREALDKIYVSGDLLLGIINDILDLSKIEAGKLEIINDRYEIASLLSDTAQLNMMRIGSKPIEFELCADENIPVILKGDEIRVKQILNNLLSNAFKYTAEGNVRLTVFTEDKDNREDNEDNGDNVTLVFSISDTGQGMTQEQVNKLFDEYARFNIESNRSTEGTGLGMSITRNLIRMMHGGISIESEPDKGSVFTVRIPQVRIGSETLGREMAENLHQFKTSSRAQMKRVQITREPMPYGSVLIVDDVETNIYVAKGLLMPYGLKIDSAESGFAAIEKIKHGNKYDIIFMDHMMPKMDGVETTKIIREMGYELPIVALTANAVAGQADIFLGNGFDDYISKPVDVRQLNNILNKLIRNKQTPEMLRETRKNANKNNCAPALQPVIDPKFAAAFVRDSYKSLAVLENIAEKNDYENEDNMRNYIINVHGIKSALANVGRMELSAIALKLDAAGREGKLDVIKSTTSDFINSLREFTDALVSEKKEKEEEVSYKKIDEADKLYLLEQLVSIKDACGFYDKNAANKAIAALKEKEKTWNQSVRFLLETIEMNLLHSDFDEIIEITDKFIQQELPDLI